MEVDVVRGSSSEPDADLFADGGDAGTFPVERHGPAGTAGGGLG